MKIHFIYKQGDRISTPFSITNEVYVRLKKKYDVVLYDFDEAGTIIPEKGDILIGHPHPFKDTIFRNSYQHENWSRKIMISPYHHGIIRYFALFDDLYDGIDLFLAICGKYWYHSMPEEIFSHWYPLALHMELAVNHDHFPFIKTSFNPPGKRKFLYIGSTLDYKSTDYLAELTLKNPDITFGWIGFGEIKSTNLVKHGVLNFSDPDHLEIVKSYDFLLTTGKSDANPTTILESAAWGLIPVCTKESGYYEENWVVNVPLYNADDASNVIQHLNNSDDSYLKTLQANGQSAINKQYNWTLFADKVFKAIEAPLPIRPELNAKKKIHRLFLKLISLNYKWKTMNYSLSFLLKKIFK